MTVTSPGATGERATGARCGGTELPSRAPIRRPKGVTGRPGRRN
ncbi:hypothetical protein MicB006_5312 [Micromonospora sp. B006]|nr:hypothetical protein MicB006_5312 [Micromonospora sp. B006]